MADKLLEKILLQHIKKEEKSKFVIYGTSDVADVYYKYIANQFGHESIEFFIDGKKNLKEFNGKKVYTCDEIKAFDVNTYKYIIGTVSKIPLFINNLNKAGVHNKNIIKTVNYFSADHMEACVEGINDIYLYPQVTEEKQLKSLINELKNYIIIPEGSNHKVKIYSTVTQHSEIPNGYEIIYGKVHTGTKNDLTLVWDVESLLEEQIQSTPNVYCCNDKVIVHLCPKIFSMAMKKMIKEKSDAYYGELSKKHFKELMDLCNEYDSAIICATGPSLKKLPHIHEKVLPEAIIVVCNGFYKMENEFKNIEPMVYIVQDNDYLTIAHKYELDGIADYVIRKNIFLCVNDRWVPVLCQRYPELENKIIGFRQEDEKDVFPDIEDLAYTSSPNVVTAMCLPIASSMVDKLYLLGCDGMKNGKWEYVYEVDGKLDLDNFSTISLTPEYSETIEQYACSLDAAYKRILEFGESKNKKYMCLAHSFYNELEKRYYKK